MGGGTNRGWGVMLLVKQVGVDSVNQEGTRINMTWEGGLTEGGGHVTGETGGGGFCKSQGYQDKFYMTWEGGLTEGGGSCY